MMRSLLKARILGLLAAALILSAAQANASVIFTLQQVGDDVIMTGSGSLDLTGFTPNLTFSIDPQLSSKSFFLVGAKGASFTEYDGPITGPTSIGPGDWHPVLADSGTGDLFGMGFGPGSPQSIPLPVGYVSGQPLSGTATYVHKLLFGGVITPGTYVWTLGNGDTITLKAIDPFPATVPEPTTLSLVATGCLGLASRRRRIERQVVQER
jgi:hypothetical protein